MADKLYIVNEVYATLHGEGVRMGIPHVFVRFSQCNLACGFCDTEYESGREITAAALVQLCIDTAAGITPDITPRHLPTAIIHGRVLDQSACRNVLFCGGEPLLQLDVELVNAFHEAGWHTSVETNGTVDPEGLGIDWVTLSPKVAEHAVKVMRCSEVKYVRAAGQGIPHPVTVADHYLISPMFTADRVDPATLQWCIRLVQQNPRWRLTVQAHKILFGNLR